MTYARFMAANSLVIQFVIAEDPQKFPTTDELPDGMKPYDKFGPTRVWTWQREVPNETIECEPDVVIRNELDRLKVSHRKFFEYLGVVQHWWPVFHPRMSDQRQDRVDAYTDDTKVSVDWNYLLVRQANATQLEDLIRISAQMVARCYGLTEAIRNCQVIMSDIPDATNLAKLREGVGALEAVKHALLVDIVTSDARPSVYGSYAFETYSEIRRVWNMEEIEVSSQRSLDACESLLASIRQASQAKRDRWRAHTLLSLTIVSSVSAVFSFFSHINDSKDSSDFLQFGVPVIVAVGAAVLFGVLHRMNSE